MTDTETFQSQVQTWLSTNFPSSLANKGAELLNEDFDKPEGDWKIWVERLAAQGWGAPTWPKEYGGAGLSHQEASILLD